MKTDFKAMLTGYAINSAGVVNMTFSVEQRCLESVQELFNALTEEISISVEDKPIGKVMLKNITVDSVGKSKVKFTGLIEDIESETVQAKLIANEESVNIVAETKE